MPGGPDRPASGGRDGGGLCEQIHTSIERRREDRLCGRAHPGRERSAQERQHRGGSGDDEGQPQRLNDLITKMLHQDS